MVDILGDAELEDRMTNMTDRKLAEFTLRQVNGICSVCSAHAKRIKALEERDTKAFGVAGGLGVFVGTAFSAAAMYIWGKIKGG